MKGEPDCRPCVSGPSGGPTCLRGTAGCTLDHFGPPVVEAWGIEAVLNTSGRESTDFIGAVE